MWLALASAVASGCAEDPVERARALQAEGRFEEATDLLRGLLAARPDDSELHHLYGLNLLQTGQPSLAVWSLRRAAQDPARAVEDGLLLARTLLGERNAADAAVAADAVLAVAPENVDALALRGVARIASGREADGLPDVERALVEHPDGIDLHLARVSALVATRRLDEVEPALDEAERVAAAAEGGADVEGRLCAIRATFSAEKGDTDEASERFGSCLDRYPTSFLVLREAVRHFDRVEDYERATAAIHAAYEAMPEQPAFLLAWVGRLEAIGQLAEAETLLRKATPTLGAAAWAPLIDHYTAHERWDEAAEATQALIALLPDPPPILEFTYADLLAEAGHVDRSKELAAALPSPFRELLEGKILLLRGQPRAALTRLEAGIRLWPQNPLARYLAAHAALELADIDRAMQEYREAVRADPGYTEAAVELARLHERQGQYDSGLAVLAPYVDAVPDDAEALELRHRLARKLGRTQLASRSLAVLFSLPGQRSRAVALNVAALGESKGVDEALTWLAESRVDLTTPSSAPILRALVDLLASAGRAGEGVARVEAALAVTPDAAALHEVHGRALRAAGDLEAASAAFSRAIELEPENLDALLALAELASRGGDLEGALALCDRAASAHPASAEPAWVAAQSLDRAGAPNARLTSRLEQVLAIDPAHARAATRLAVLLADESDSNAELERALVLARRGVRFGAGPEAWDAVGRVELRSGEPAQAASAFERSLGRRDDPSTRYRLGVALAASGQLDAARDALEVALASGPFPEAEAARAALAGIDAAAPTARSEGSSDAH